MTIDSFRPPQKTVIFPVSDSGTLMLSDALTIDCVTSEAWTDDAQPTRLPVEEGADVTDHVVDQPTRLSLGVVHTNHPANLPGVGDVPSPMRARFFYETLFRFKSTRQLLTIVTPHRVGENMLLVSIPPTWDAVNGEGFVATLAFEEIVRVSTKIVDVPTPANASGKPVKNGGAKGLKTVEPAEAVSFLRAQVGG